MTDTFQINPVLRQFRESDALVLAELCNNKKVWDNLRDTIPFPYKLSDAEYFINSCSNENPKLTFAIGYGDEFAGVIGFVVQKDVYRLSAELGYWIGEPYWGKGIASRAVELATEYGFAQLGLVRIFAAVFEYNSVSRRVLEKNGYRLEGIFRNSVIKNGRIIDEYRYAKVNEQNLKKYIQPTE